MNKTSKTEAFIDLVLAQSVILQRAFDKKDFAKIMLLIQKAQKKSTTTELDRLLCGRLIQLPGMQEKVDLIEACLRERYFEELKTLLPLRLNSGFFTDALTPRLCLAGQSELLTLCTRHYQTLPASHRPLFLAGALCIDPSKSIIENQVLTKAHFMMLRRKSHSEILNPYEIAIWTQKPALLYQLLKPLSAFCALSAQDRTGAGYSKDTLENTGNMLKHMVKNLGRLEKTYPHAFKEELCAPIYKVFHDFFANSPQAILEATMASMSIPSHATPALELNPVIQKRNTPEISLEATGEQDERPRRSAPVVGTPQGSPYIKSTPKRLG